MLDRQTRQLDKHFILLGTFPQVITLFQPEVVSLYIQKLDEPFCHLKFHHVNFVKKSITLLLDFASRSDDSLISTTRKSQHRETDFNFYNGVMAISVLLKSNALPRMKFNYSNFLAIWCTWFEVFSNGRVAKLYGDSCQSFRSNLRIFFGCSLYYIHFISIFV